MWLLPLSYGLCSFSLLFIHNIFLLFYIDIFVSHFHISEAAFFWGQILFLLWNSLNDPLFGYLADRSNLHNRNDHHGDRVSLETLRRRITAVGWAGSAMAVAFLGFWFDWGLPMIQFVVCLLVYDGFLTYVDLNHQALLADLTLDSKERANLNRFNSIFAILACSSVFFSYHFWGFGLESFQIFTLVLSVISFLGFQLSSFGMRYCLDQGWIIPVTSEAKPEKQDIPVSQSFRNWMTFLRDFGTQPNFLYFSAMHLVQVFHCHFNSNFFPIFLDALLGDTYSRPTRSVLLGISFVLPHLNNVLFSSLSAKFGLYSVVFFLFFCKFLGGIGVWIAGMGSIPLLLLFIISNRVFTEGTCKLIGLCITDLVDEDYVLHNRKESVSALIFGTTALFAKPGQTLAPLVGTWILTNYGGNSVFSNVMGETSMNKTEFDPAIRPILFNMAVGVTLICAAIQIFAWSRYSLHGERLAKIKQFSNKGHSKV